MRYNEANANAEKEQHEATFAAQNLQRQLKTQARQLEEARLEQGQQIASVERLQEADRLNIERERQADREAAQRNQDEREDRVEVRMKYLVELVKSVIYNKLENDLELPLFFEAGENAFAKFNTPNDYKATLIMPYHTVKARMLLGRKPPDLTNDYDLVKEDYYANFHSHQIDIELNLTGHLHLSRRRKYSLSLG